MLRNSLRTTSRNGFLECVKRRVRIFHNNGLGRLVCNLRQGLDGGFHIRKIRQVRNGGLVNDNMNSVSLQVNELLQVSFMDGESTQGYSSRVED